MNLPIATRACFTILVSLFFAACSGESLEDAIAYEAVNESYSIPSPDAKEGFMVLDFNELHTGAIPEKLQFPTCDGFIMVNAINPDKPSVNACYIFDSSKPNPGNEDLGTPNELFGGPGRSADGPQESNDTPLGNVLVICDDPGSASPEVSYRSGTKFIFNFTKFGAGNTTVQGFDLLDLNEPGSDGLATTVELYDTNNQLIREFTLTPSEDNAKQYIDLGSTPGVGSMVIEMNNSGAIDNIRLSCTSGYQDGGNGDESDPGNDEPGDDENQQDDEENNEEDPDGQEEEEEEESDGTEEDGSADEEDGSDDDTENEGDQDHDQDTGNENEEDHNEEDTGSEDDSSSTDEDDEEQDEQEQDNDKEDDEEEDDDEEDDEEEDEDGDDEEDDDEEDDDEEDDDEDEDEDEDEDDDDKDDDKRQRHLKPTP